MQPSHNSSILSSILADHALWLKTDGKQGQRANLKGAVLTRASFAKTDLRCVDLTNADFYGSDLRDANLSGATLSGVNFAHTDLRNANLSGANLEGANFEFAKLDGVIDLPDVSWMQPGCLVQLCNVSYSFYCTNDTAYRNFEHNGLGVILHLRPVPHALEYTTFDVLTEDEVIRGIPSWVMYTGVKQCTTNSLN